MEITVKLFAGLAAGAGHAQMVVDLPESATVSDLLAALRQRDPDTYRRIREGLDSGYIQALRDGRNVRFLAGEDTVLSEGVTVAFLPPVGGG
jgi:molybdopterin converting factor small subunit